MAVFKLPRLPTNWQTQPKLVERYWDTTMSNLEKTLNAILAIPAIEEALVDLDTATQAAQDAADNANAAASSVTSENSLVTSYPSLFVAPLISADNLGNVTIANHSRIYGDSVLNPTRLVTGGVIATGAAASSIVRVYYNDINRLGGSVTYLYTIDPAPPPVQGGVLHSVGAVTIPAAGTQNGNGVRPPGFVEL